MNYTHGKITQIKLESTTVLKGQAKLKEVKQIYILIKQQQFGKLCRVVAAVFIPWIKACLGGRIGIIRVYQLITNDKKQTKEKENEKNKNSKVPSKQKWGNYF